MRLITYKHWKAECRILMLNCIQGNKFNKYGVLMVTHWNISEENWRLFCGTVWFNQYSQVDRNARSQACMFLFTIPIVLYRRFHLTCARCSGYASVPKLTSGSIYTYMDKYLVENKKILVSEKRRNIARMAHRQGWTWRNNRPWHFGPLHSVSKTSHLCATLTMYTNSKSYNDFKKKERNRQRCALYECYGLVR